MLPILSHLFVYNSYLCYKTININIKLIDNNGTVIIFIHFLTHY